MKTNFAVFCILVTILIAGTFGLFVVDYAFAQNLYVSSNNSEAHKKQKELKEKKDELDTHRKNLEAKQLKKLKEYKEKLKEIKDQSQYKIEKNISDNDKKLSQKSTHLKETPIKKSEEIQKKLAAKSNKLDLRTKNILDKINNGQYMGEKISSSNTEKYELLFDSVDASLIDDKSQTSSLTGKMIFSTYDKGKFDLKLELDECKITIDEITYNCGFGKARTISSNPSNIKNSLVIVAFLEDDILEELHSTLKIFLNADIPINSIEQSQVSILGPQSKLSNMWFLNGTATLSKIVSTSEQTTTGTNSTVTLEDDISTGNK